MINFKILKYQKKRWKQLNQTVTDLMNMKNKTTDEEFNLFLNFLEVGAEKTSKNIISKIKSIAI